MSCTTAGADDTKATQNTEVAKSIESILQKASEQGFVVLKSEPEQTESDDTLDQDAPEIIIEQLSANPQGETSCEIAEILDLKNYMSVETYSDIAAAKSKMVSIDTLDDRIPLLKTYWSLGLGTEALALADPYDDRRSPLIKSVSQIISGDVNEYNKSVLNRYEPCNDSAKIWYKTALAASNSKTANEAKTVPDDADLKILESMPTEIRKILTRRLGIFAAEAGEVVLADKMLKSIEPDAENGKLPMSKDDETMYLFALVDASQKGKKGVKILERLSQFDGPLRTRSIFQLSDKYTAGDHSPYPGFSDDLESVSQQYRGKDESRMASFETIKLHLKNGSTVQSMKLTKRDLGAKDPERLEVVTMIADHILSGLNEEKNGTRIGALNAYLFDTGFFTPLASHAELKHAALEAALALNLPELEGQIYADGDEKNLNENGLKRLALAKMQAARKSGDINKVKELAKAYKDDVEFSALLIESLVELGHPQDAIKVVKAMPYGPQRYAKLADLEWQVGDFEAAHSNLQSLDYASGGKSDDTKLKVTGLLTSADATYSNLIVPNSSDDLDELKSDINEDINIAKAYLTGG